MAISSPGIGSNLDVNSIVSQLMAVESQPLTTLNKKEAATIAKVSAFNTLKGALGSFQTALDALKLPSKFQGVNATAADTTIVSGTATSKAVAGSYTVDVTKLAQAQTISTGGRATSTAPIGDGMTTTLTFQFGTITGGKLTNGVYGNDPAATPPDPTFTQDPNQIGGSVVIDSSNNSMQGIRDAINKAKIGVTATIVSDGSANPHRLVLTSTATGAVSSMKISVARETGAPVDTSMSDLLAYNPAGVQNMTQSTAAQDTAVTINGIPVSAKTRTVAEAIQGVTLNVSKVGSTTLTLARDTASVQSGVQSLVKAYNDLEKTIKSLTSYDPATKVGGALLGDASVRNIQAQVRSMLGTSLTGSGSPLTNLTQVGVTFQKDGTMALDSAKLTTAIETNFDHLAGLFASVGTSTDSLVKFIGSTAQTKPGSGLLHVSALATRGNTTATAAPTTLTITAGSNDQMSLTVDGISTSVTLAASTYTSASLVAHLQSKINGASEFTAAGVSVAVSTGAGGQLAITSNRYGSASKVVVSGTAATSLLPGGASTDGIDVAGTIGGVTATGSGQLLTAGTGSTLSGVKFEVTGGPAPAARGTVGFSQGYADLLTKLVDNFTGTDGMIIGQTNSLQNTIKDIGKSRDAMNLKLQGIEKRYRAQFNALDASIARMTSTSNYLTQQLAQLSTVSK
ncbi:flagellar filament capping protein FliD [Massilia cavernae]|uniref:Flagellar hook-associated protein 2 n=1 Tax=Massilia cavernae TaxID=2320864 RepID=A0A418XSM6_9BURK|nr:flagellar filament capping protein FliD [Massilia cavernae]RJG15593.1 flagellar hook protein FliD [Massilia cavernae]